MKNLIAVLAILATGSFAFANHVIECSDQSGQIIMAHIETQPGNMMMADVTITGVHYNGYNNNTSGVIHNVPVTFHPEWHGFSLDFQDLNYAYPDVNFTYSVNGLAVNGQDLALLVQDVDQGAGQNKGAISYRKVNDDPSSWTKLTGPCQSWEE